MLLHEKGRVQLKKENYAEALILFLEADGELQSCQSDLINSIDNVAILNLDIVWCYLCLKSIMQLPDAQRRLSVCETSFKRSYGENYQRLESIKGSSASEKALILRLHLMQAILLFHLNRRSEASAMFSVAEREIQELHVDVENVSTLIEMGYNRNEAITGLRSSFNSEKLGKKERLMESFLNELGVSGFVNPRTLHTLIDMGYPQAVCALALKKCDNDIEKSLSLLQTSQTQLKEELVSIIKPQQDLIEQMS